MFQIILAVHAVLCFVLVSLVLLQEGKDIGAAFGAGGANSLFGSAGIDRPIVRATTGVAVLFMITSILLVNMYAGIGETAGTKVAPLPEELNRINQSVNIEKGAPTEGDKNMDGAALPPAAAVPAPEKKIPPAAAPAPEKAEAPGPK